MNSQVDEQSFGNNQIEDLTEMRIPSKINPPFYRGPGQKIWN